MSELPQLYIVTMCPFRQLDQSRIRVDSFADLIFGLVEDVKNKMLISVYKKCPPEEGWQLGGIFTFHVSNEKLAQLVKDTSNGIETFKKELEL